MTDLTVANTILAQLGGNRFRAMTGAKNFVGSDDSLTFRLPGNPGFVKQGINCVRITLTPADLYRVEFLRVRGAKFGMKETREDVYADKLASVFREVTGLATNL